MLTCDDDVFNYKHVRKMKIKDKDESVYKWDNMSKDKKFKDSMPLEDKFENRLKETIIHIDANNSSSWKENQNAHQRVKTWLIKYVNHVCHVIRGLFHKGISE